MSSTLGDADRSSEIRPADDRSPWLMFVTFLSLVAVALSIVALALYATRDISGGGGGGGGGGAAPPASAELQTKATDFAFDPDSWNAPADQDLTMVLDNGGAVEHNLTILSQQIASEAEFSEDLVLGHVGNTPPGESGTADVAGGLPAGTYQVICTVAGHFAAGMHGTLTVA